MCHVVKIYGYCIALKEIDAFDSNLSKFCYTLGQISIIRNILNDLVNATSLSRFIYLRRNDPFEIVVLLYL